MYLCMYNVQSQWLDICKGWVRKTTREQLFNIWYAISSCIQISWVVNFIYLFIFSCVHSMLLMIFSWTASSCNSFTKTFDGIDRAGKRLADEVVKNLLLLTEIHLSCHDNWFILETDLECGTEEWKFTKDLYIGSFLRWFILKICSSCSIFSR